MSYRSWKWHQEIHTGKPFTFPWISSLSHGNSGFLHCTYPNVTFMIYMYIEFLQDYLFPLANLANSLIKNHNKCVHKFSHMYNNNVLYEFDLLDIKTDGQ